MLVRKFLLFGWMLVAASALLFNGCKNNTASNADPREANRVIDAPSIAYIKALDKKSKSIVFVLTKDYPELKGLRNKVILVPPLNQDLSLNFDEYLHKDYIGPIYMLMPSYYTGIRASVILKCFPGYKGFTFTDLSDNYVVYHTNQKR
jgi:hypothetical protein